MVLISTPIIMKSLNSKRFPSETPKKLCRQGIKRYPEEIYLRLKTWITEDCQAKPKNSIDKASKETLKKIYKTLYKESTEKYQLHFYWLHLYQPPFLLWSSKQFVDSLVIVSIIAVPYRSVIFFLGGSKPRISKAKETTSLNSADESDSQSSLKVGGPSTAKRTRYDGDGSLDEWVNYYLSIFFGRFRNWCESNIWSTQSKVYNVYFIRVF